MSSALQIQILSPSLSFLWLFFPSMHKVFVHLLNLTMIARVGNVV